MELSNRFQALENLENMDINDHWVKIKEVVNSTCADKLGPKKRLGNYRFIGKNQEKKGN